MDPRNLFQASLPLIERVIAVAARRRALDPDVTDDFKAWVHERLIENDYAVLRKFQERSSLATYLAVVIANLLRDYDVQRWGRWRPSAEAKRLGNLAVRLETLLYRDGRTIREAIAVLRGRNELPLSDREITKLAMRLPHRVRRREVGEPALRAVAASDTADGGVVRAEADSLRQEVDRAIDVALHSMPQEDQLILRLRFWEGRTVADIARLLGLEQRPLYRRMERLFVTLRERLETMGVDVRAVREVLGEGLP